MSASSDPSASLQGFQLLCPARALQARPRAPPPPLPRNVSRCPAPRAHFKHVRELHPLPFPAAFPAALPRARTSNASASASSLSSRSKLPVPSGHSCPSITFSLTPVMWSFSANMAARNRMSTVSSKEHCASGPLPLRLIPWRVMAMRWPRDVITSHRIARWRKLT
eukprot:181812-Chlamydomonas_euryale.AAC.1